ncbi:MAG TPA: formate dehydrogenase accessory sulfurtransferase FdhD [Chloroflexia bacterium]|nr:formate dehydrogenase accessory sulfurtransferase FdhD [Chloroflexia bacterium]
MDVTPGTAMTNDMQASASSVTRFVGHEAEVQGDLLPVEEPLQIRLAGEDVVVTMRTPGHDEELAAGFLFTEGIIAGKTHIESIVHCPDDANGGAPSPNVVNVTPTDRSLLDPARWQRNMFASSSCGVCGKISIEQVRMGRLYHPMQEKLSVDLETLYSLPGKIRQAQTGFEQTGGLHAAALFTPDGHLLVLREDVGRHNAVDKVIGHALIEGLLPLDNHVLVVTSRASFEIVQKALAAGVRVMATISAPTSLAVEMAQEGGITLVAFLRDRRCNVYAGAL